MLARLRALVVLALLLGVSLPLGNVAHAAFVDDAKCRHADDYSPATPHVEPIGTLSPLSHCAICHLASADGQPSVASVAVAGMPAREADLLTHVPPQKAGAAGAKTQPSRAPPATA